LFHLITFEKGAFENKIDAKKLAITGFSRWGKAALVIGAFAKSKTGTQIAVTAPGSAGSGGPTIERFISSTGAKDDYITSIDQDLNGNLWIGTAATGIAKFDGVNVHKYSKEELVAEFAACFLSAEAGIERTSEIQNSASYLKNWAAKLKDDPRIFVGAAQQAQKAADYVLGKVDKEKEEEEEAREAA